MLLLPEREDRDLEITGMDEKAEAMRVVFTQNIAKQVSKFEPRGKEET